MARVIAIPGLGFFILFQARSFHHNEAFVGVALRVCCSRSRCARPPRSGCRGIAAASRGIEKASTQRDAQNGWN